MTTVFCRVRTLFNLFILTFFFAACTILFANFADRAYALESDYESDSESAAHVSKLLNMDLKEIMQIEVISATRGLKPLSETPENMTVITAKDIELMNAHTVAEVLNTVTGIAVDFAGASLGINSSISIQGSDSTHVTALVDGVPINQLVSGVPELIEKLPVQIIERIEIIKGPASSTWGSALGGIINIITKSGSGTKGLNGTLSASYGESDTGDYKAEVYGQKNKFEYYLHAGDFRTDGLQPGFDADRTGIFSKLAYSISSDTKVTAGLYYDYGRSGEGYDTFPNPTTYYSDRYEHVLGNLSLNSKLSSSVSLDMALYTLQQIWKTYLHSMPDMSQIFYEGTNSQSNGANAKVAWATGMHMVVAGADYSKGILKNPSLLNGRQELQKWDLFINDTIVWNKLSVVPGIRFDHSDDFGSFFSPSLGATYKLSGNTLLRATVARGFNNPNLFARFGTNLFTVANPNLKVEEVTSYQAGIETTALPFVWVKVSAFRHDVSKALETVTVGSSSILSTVINSGKVRHQGVEAEVMTLPVFHTSFFGGATYTSSKNLVTNMTELGVPTYTFNAGLKYDNDKLFRAILQGHYIWWNQDSSFNAKYNAMIFDMSITKTVFRHKDMACDIFLSAHNIFDGSQYAENYFPNPGRWFEGGIRYKF